MQRCLELAKIGIGNVAPNPMVGCVIVADNKIIGEGYHKKCGEAHAEVNAINSVKNQELLKHATLYVNLEPCAHYGRTPPCSKLIIDKKIPSVVIGCIDSFSEVAGKGIIMMRNAGCNVTVGILEKESRELNKRFFTFHEKKRPYIILKWAQTLDGFIDFNRSENLSAKAAWITNDISKMLVHKWRSEENGIMVGRVTAAKDNPQLNIREWWGNAPVRIVMDRNLQLSEKLHLFDNKQKTLVFNSIKNDSQKLTEYIKVDFNNNLLKNILDNLYNREIQSVIVEGGEMVLSSFINENLWDETRLFVGNKIFENGVKAPQLKNAKFVSEDKLGNSSLYLYRNKKI